MSMELEILVPDGVVFHERVTAVQAADASGRFGLLPGHEAQAARHFDAARATLQRYGEWFGAYPYGHLTMVDAPPETGTEVMEYPTLFTVGTVALMPKLPASVPRIRSSTSRDSLGARSESVHSTMPAPNEQLPLLVDVEPTDSAPGTLI